MRWRPHPCFLLASGNRASNNERHHGDNDDGGGFHRYHHLSGRMPKRGAQELQQTTRTFSSRKSSRTNSVAEHQPRNRPPSPMDISSAPTDESVAAIAAAAVAAAGDFDVRASLTRLGSFRASRADDDVPVPGGPLSPSGAISNLKAGVAKNNEKSISNKVNGGRSGGADDDDDDDDDDETGRSKSLTGPCRSIEDASVNTTVESVAAEEGERAASSDAKAEAAAEDDDDATNAARRRNVKISLTPEEERLFKLLSDAAEAYEAGELAIDPNPPQQSVSARGGFVKKQESEEDEKSWLKPPPKVERIEIRVAGGWVRDKLLNQHSCDVDVALDCMMGVQFARIVQSHMAAQQEKEDKEKEEKVIAGAKEGEKTEEGLNGDDKTKMADENKAADPKGKGAKQQKKQQQKKKKNKQPKIGVIGANPSQSKHLETATMTVHGIDVDFVNLRAEEVYLPGSRIPTSDTKMFGTPLEDALRRDFTINSLFYNVRSGRIEDWTGRGLDDLLARRRIVTPVDPHVTFHDDPLRVLRAVRFAIRLDFALDDSIAEAARSQRVHHSLHVKVSRERVGKEVEGMLSGKHARPARALDAIADLHLAGSVFCFPGSFPGDSDGNYGKRGPIVSGNIMGVPYSCSLGTKNCPEAAKLASKQRARGWDESSALLALLPGLMEGHAAERKMLTTQQCPTGVNERLLHLCTFILPFHDLTFPDRKGTRTISVTAHMIKEALKFPIRDVQAVSKILGHVDEMAEILGEIRAASEAREERGEAEEEGVVPPCRLRLGLLLRSLKEHWVTCLLTAAAWEVRSRRRIDVGGDGIAAAEADRTTVEDDAIAEDDTTSIADDRPSRLLYNSVASALDLDECWRVPPHLNGKEMIKELGLPKGPIVGTYLEDQTRWMLSNPGGTREECAEYLRGRRREREEEEAERKAAREGAAKGEEGSTARSKAGEGKGPTEEVRAAK